MKHFTSVNTYGVTAVSDSVEGMQFRVEIKDDYDHEAPWDSGDGQGIVSDWTRHEKKPGERVLSTDGQSKRYFDFAATVEKAKRESWGVSDEARAVLVKQLGRPCSPGEIAVAAVEQNYKWFKAWCDDEWRYVGVVLERYDDAREDYVVIDATWGIESDCEEYLCEVANDMLGEYLHTVRKANTVQKAKTDRLLSNATHIMIELAAAGCSQNRVDQFIEICSLAGIEYKPLQASKAAG